jgi:hypothetical protein
MIDPTASRPAESEKLSLSYPSPGAMTRQGIGESLLNQRSRSTDSLDLHVPAAPTSLVPLKRLVTQVAGTTGVVMSSFCQAAESTHRGDPYGYRYWQGLGVCSAAVAFFMQVHSLRDHPLTIQEGLRLGGSLVSTGMAGVGAAVLQRGIDGHNLIDQRLGALILSLGIVGVMGCMAIALGADQLRWGRFPMPSWLQDPSRRNIGACLLATAAMVGAGVSYGLHSLAPHHELQRCLGLGVAFLGVLPAVWALSLATLPASHVEQPGTATPA